MSWSRTAAALLLLALAGCGFRPLYGETGPESPADERLAAVAVEPIEERMGQLLRNALLLRLTPAGEPARPFYRLSVDLDRRVTRFAYRQDETPTRARMSVVAAYLLNDGGAGKPLTAGTARAIVSWDLRDANYATVTAERDAEDRAARLLAEAIKTRLGVYFAGEPRRP